MKTVIRKSYKPKLGDYCNTLVVDNETGNQYLFDKDGVWTLISTDEEGIVAEAVAQANAYTDDVAEGKVDKEEGKGLSENDFTDEDKDKLDSVEAGAQENVIEVVKRNGVALPVVDKTVDVTVPTTTSALTNDSGYITNAVDDLVNYYDKDETDTLIETEALTRDAADQDLQEQIDAIVASSDVVDIVGTYAELQNYDTSKLHDNDIIKVLTDETRDDATTYYRWDDGTDTFTYIGSEGPYYTKGEADATFVPLTRTINGKGLNSDVVLTAADVGALPSSTVIPTVNDATLTIQKNGTNVATFTANSATNTTANIAVPTKTSDLVNDGADNTSTYVEADELATVATSGSYNDLTDKPTIDFELVEMSYGESNAWAKFIAAYRGHKIVYCRASSNSNPATGTQGRKAFMAYVNNAENPTEVEFQYVRSVSSKTSSQPVDQVYVYKLTSANGGTWTVQTRDMGPKLAQGTNTTVSYANGTYTISATQPTVNNATLTIKKNGSSVGTFTANSSTNTDVDITVPTKTSDLTNDSGFIDKNVSDLTNYYDETTVNSMFNALTIPTKTSDLTNDSGFITNTDYASASTGGVVKVGSGLSIDANGVLSSNGLTSVDWSDVTNKPTNVSYWTNDAGYITSAAVPTKTSDLTNDSGFITSASLPTKTSDLTNDSGFITSSVNNLANYYKKSETYTQGEVNSLINAITVPTKTSDLTNDGSDGTSTYVEADDLATVATSGSYNDLSNKPTIGNATLTIQQNGTTVQTFTANATSGKTANITVPTKTSDLTNDSNFVSNTDYATAATGGVIKVGEGLEITNGVLSATGGGVADAVEWDNVLNKPTFSTVATSGSYNDLTDKPTIPTVNNATLTIQRNSTNVGTFTANASSNKTINITVPTTAADVSALPASTKYGASITVSLNTTDYKMTTTLKDQDGNTLGTAQTIDLPLESVVVNGSYDSTNKKIVLTLQSGSTIDIPVADLVAGLQSEITSTNKLASDLVDDTNQTHKFMTSAEKTKLSGIAAGAEVNVQSDWTQTTTTADDYIKNKPTLATVATSGSYNDLSNKPTIPTVNNATLTIQKNGTTVKTFTANASSNVTANITVPTKTSDITNDSNFVASGDLATVATSGSYNDLTNKPTIPAAQVQSNWTQTTTTAVDYIKNKPTLATVATSGSYNDLSNKPTIPTVNNGQLTIQKNGSNVATFTANQSGNSTANISVPTKTSDITNDSNFTTTATAQKFAIGQGSTQPVFDDMTPLQTIEWDVSDTTYRPIYQMENTGWTYTNMDITVAYRVTVTGTNINSVTDVVDRWFNPASWPLTSALLKTQSTSAATTGLKYLRAVYPTGSYVNNNTYKLGVELEMHNTTARHVKVEVFKTNSAVTWNSTKPSGSIYQGNSTYQGTNSIEVYTTRGWRFRQPVQMYANSAGAANYIQDFEAANIAAGDLKAGATALAAGHFAFLADDGLVYDISNTAKNIAMGESKVGFMNTAVSANTAISWTYWRTISRPNATQLGYFNHDTFVLGDRVFLRCTMDSNGNIHSGNYLSKTMSAGYTWMPFGWARSATTLYVDTRFPMFYTLDSNGKLTHINGKQINAGSSITVDSALSTTSTNPVQNKVITTELNTKASNTALAAKQDLLTAGAHINITGTTIKAVDYVHSEQPVATSSVTPVVTGSMISNGTITADKLASGATLKLTLSTSDIGEGAALAANTLYGVYQ